MAMAMAVALQTETAESSSAQTSTMQPSASQQSDICHLEMTGTFLLSRIPVALPVKLVVVVGSNRCWWWWWWWWWVQVRRCLEASGICKEKLDWLVGYLFVMVMVMVSMHCFRSI